MHLVQEFLHSKFLGRTSFEVDSCQNSTYQMKLYSVDFAADQEIHLETLHCPQPKINEPFQVLLKLPKMMTQQMLALAYLHLFILINVTLLAITFRNSFFNRALIRINNLSSSVSYPYPMMTRFQLHYHQAYFVDAHAHQDQSFLQFDLIVLQVVELRYFLDFQYFARIPFLKQQRELITRILQAELRIQNLPIVLTRQF